jgi:hypothetical protein
VLLSGGIWFLLRPIITASKPVSTTPKSVASTVVTSASLKPLVLKSATAESPSVPIGQYAKFKVQLVNTATNGKSDPRMVNRQAKVVAQIKTFLKPDGGERRNAPVFPKKFSISQIPDLGQVSDIEIPISTEGMPPGEYEVTFELQSPDGKMIENSDSNSVSEPESAASGGPIGSN